MFPKNVGNIPLLLGNLFPLLLLVFVLSLPITNAVRIEEKGKISIHFNFLAISDFILLFLLRINLYLPNNKFNIRLRESKIQYIGIYVKKQQYYFVQKHLVAVGLSFNSECALVCVEHYRVCQKKQNCIFKKQLSSVSLYISSNIFPWKQNLNTNIAERCTQYFSFLSSEFVYLLFFLIRLQYIYVVQVVVVQLWERCVAPGQRKLAKRRLRPPQSPV